MITKRLLNLKEAAFYLGVSQQVFKEFVCVRPVNIPFCKTVKRFDINDLDVWVSKMKHEADESPTMIELIVGHR